MMRFISQKGCNFTIVIIKDYKLRIILLYRSLIKFFRESVDLQFDEIRLGFHFRVREAGAGVGGGGVSLVHVLDGFQENLSRDLLILLI